MVVNNKKTEIDNIPAKTDLWILPLLKWNSYSIGGDIKSQSLRTLATKFVLSVFIFLRVDLVNYSTDMVFLTAFLSFEFFINIVLIII